MIKAEKESLQDTHTYANSRFKMKFKLKKSYKTIDDALTSTI